MNKEMKEVNTQLNQLDKIFKGLEVSSYRNGYADSIIDVYEYLSAMIKDNGYSDEITKEAAEIIEYLKVMIDKRVTEVEGNQKNNVIDFNNFK